MRVVSNGNMSGNDRRILTQLGNDELLLHHLNFFVEGLEIDEVKLVNMLKEDPNWGKCCSI